uniref:Uncharacterized protein n=1 Tax=Anopheles albimanus TaxID=7167 RepID=A0A182FXM3_ANOAL
MSISAMPSTEKNRIAAQMATLRKPGSPKLAAGIQSNTGSLVLLVCCVPVQSAPSAERSLCSSLSDLTETLRNDELEPQISDRTTEPGQQGASMGEPTPERFT